MLVSVIAQSGQNLALSQLSEYQTHWVQIRPDILSGLIWVQSVCKGYEQTTLAGNDFIRLGNDSNHFMNSRRLTLLKFIGVRYYTIIDFNEVDRRIYLPEKVIIHRSR